MPDPLDQWQPVTLHARRRICSLCEKRNHVNRGYFRLIGRASSLSLAHVFPTEARIENRLERPDAPTDAAKRHVIRPRTVRPERARLLAQVTCTSGDRYHSGNYGCRIRQAIAHLADGRECDSPHPSLLAARSVSSRVGAGDLVLAISGGGGRGPDLTAIPIDSHGHLFCLQVCRQTLATGRINIMFAADV